MNFKDGLQNDAGIFLNLNEFADAVSINGAEPRPGVILDSQAIYPGSLNNNLPDLEFVRKKLFVLAETLEDCFLEDKNVNINGKIWQIEASKYASGMVEVDLKRRSY